MAASRVTIIQLADLLDEYIDKDFVDFKWVIQGLREVEGNKSVTMTLEALARELERRHG